MIECSFTNFMVVDSIPVAVTYVSDIAPVSSKDFLNLHAFSVQIHSTNMRHDKNTTDDCI